MGALRPVHILILVLVIVILFGWKKLPDAARSLGRSMRIFKSEVEEMKKDGKTTPSAASSDTVKGETVYPTADSASAPAGPAAPIGDPSVDPSGDAVPDLPAREKQNQPPT